MNGYTMSFKDNTIFSDLLANCSTYYTYKNIEEVTGTELLLFILSPLIVICTLNIFQVTLSLLIKPLYSFNDSDFDSERLKCFGIKTVLGPQHMTDDLVQALSPYLKGK